MPDLSKLSSFQRRLYTTLVENEVSGNAKKAYSLSLSTAGNGGFTFGWVQWNLLKQGVDSSPYTIIAQAIDNISEADFQTVVMPAASTAGRR